MRALRRIKQEMRRAYARNENVLDRFMFIAEHEWITTIYIKHAR